MSDLSDQQRHRDFADLVTRVVDPVRAYLHRRTDPATADDVLSSTLSVLWRRFEDVPGDGEVAWTIGVARLQLKNASRSSRRQELLARRVAVVDPPVEAVGPSGGAAEDAEPDDDRAQAVRSTLAGLREPDAELLRLWAWEGLAPRQIAEVLDVTPNAVSIRLHRARARFAEAYRSARAGGGHDDVAGDAS